MKRLAFLFLLTATAAFAQQQTSNFENFNPRFEVFTLPGEVLGNSVQAIVQDSTGFLWFAAQEGLHRYDGQAFFTYRNDPLDSNSLASDYCEYIFLDSKGILWLAHYNAGGLTAFDPATEKFTRYYHDPNNPESLPDNTTSVVAEDHEGNIWVGCEAGLARFDKKTSQFKRFLHDPNDPRSLSHNNIRGLYLDKRGTFWVGAGFSWDGADPLQKRGGLNRFDPKTETFDRFLHDPKNPQSLAHNQVRSIFEDSRGNFWVGTGGDGLHLMDREKGTFTRFVSESSRPKKLARPWFSGISLALQPLESHVSSIFEDREGRIWITAALGGLNVFDPATGAVQHFENTPGEGNLSTNFLWQTFQSADGTVWIATGNGGATVFKVTKQGERFPFVSLCENGCQVNDAVKDKAGNVWVGYGNQPSAAIICYDRKTGKSRSIAGNNTAPDGLNARRVNTLLPDRDGFIWVGTENGLFRLDPQTEKFRHFPNPFPENFWVSYLLQDSDGYIWAYGRLIGLHRLDPRTGAWTQYRHDPADPGTIGGNNAAALYEDPDGYLWVGGGWGNDFHNPLFLDRFRPKTHRETPVEGGAAFTHFIKYKEGGSAEYIMPGGKGNLWFLNLGSLEKFTPSTGARQKVDANNNLLLRRSLTSMARAKNGKIWLNANDGHIFELDPETTILRRFGKEQGIPMGQHEFSEVFVADDGEVIIGRAGGFIAFFPDSLKGTENGRPPTVRVTDFWLIDERVAPGSRPILKNPIWKTNALRLAHDQNVFSFSVACFDFTAPAANQIQFMLEGYDKGWRIDLRDGQTPSYVNVPPGEYTFRVRGANSLGVWNMAGTSLRITISPPWWKTWWAYAFYGLCFIVALFFVNRFLRERIAEKERAKSRERELAQAQEIEKAYTELGVAHENLKATQSQLIQSEKLASLGELTAGIAHEIQNPLNFVNNFSELSVDLAKEIKEEIDKVEIPEKDKTYIGELLTDLGQNQEKINHHGKRAANIVTGMLQHARTSTGAKEPTDLNALADEYLRLSYHGLRAKDPTFNAKMVTDFDPAVEKIEVVPQDIGRVLLNLINNAFYAVKEKKSQNLEDYEPRVTVSSRLISPGMVAISIRDNGTGIPDNIKIKIFQPFFTTKPAGQGTGLGLSLAYDIVTKGHGGTLEVESAEGEGTEFIIKLPK